MSLESDPEEPHHHRGRDAGSCRWVDGADLIDGEQWIIGFVLVASTATFVTGAESSTATATWTVAVLTTSVLGGFALMARRLRFPTEDLGVGTGHPTISVHDVSRADAPA
ncbi:MAG: hypothetical protein LH624_00110, partial [Cryobacterium sp.]|nr:hypothetical protein [Cryobacterium sp.]